MKDSTAGTIHAKGAGRRRAGRLATALTAAVAVVAATLTGTGPATAPATASTVAVVTGTSTGTASTGTASTGTASTVTGSTGTASTGTACAPREVGCFPGMTFGIASEGLPTSTGAMTALEAALGHEAGVALSFTSFRFPFSTAALRAIAADGVMPMITWEPFDATAPTEDRYPLREIAAGLHDDYLRAQAAALREIAAPVALRFAHEMNGDWYPWGHGVNGNTPADYVAAYRHVHDLVEAEGVRDVTWVWSPASIDTLTAPDLAPYYPGDDYVDWAGLSAYYDSTSDTWANTLAPTVRQLDAVAPTKPIYLAETGVLPGAARPALIHELLTSLLRTPRAIGFTWFDVRSRFDWRIGQDAAALSAVRAALSSGWYPAGPTTVPAPLVQVAPAVAGVPLVGSTLTATAGQWRGADATTGRWLVCDAATASSCTPAGGTGADLVLDAATHGRTLRYEVTATGTGGTTTHVSEPTTAVVVVPTRPDRPVVESRSGGARVVLPAPTLGTTHWRLVVDGRPYELVPVGRADYWLTGLTNGTSHTLALTAVAVSGSTVLESPATSGTFTPMTQPYQPYVSVTGPTATLNLPKAPAGAETWLLTVDGVTRTLPATTTTTSVQVPLGSPTAWSLVAAAGRWDGQAPGSTTPASTGSFSALEAPDAPVVTSGRGSITLTFPTAPAGATAWRVSVGATTYPDVPVGTAAGLTATGLYPGYPWTWTLRAVNSTSRSLAVTGKAAAS